MYRPSSILLVLSLTLPVILSFALYQIFPSWLWQNKGTYTLVNGIEALAFLLLGMVLYFHGQTTRRYKSAIASFLSIGIFYELMAYSANMERVMWLDDVAAMIGAIFLSLCFFENSPRFRPKMARLPEIAVATAILLGVPFYIAAPFLPKPFFETDFSTFTDVLNFVSAIPFLASAAHFFLLYRRSKNLEAILIGSIAFYLGISSLLLPFTHVWGEKWWHLQGLEIVPTFIAFGFVFFRVRSTHLILLSNEKELKSLNQRLLKSNEELEKFSAVASHDLKSPLNTLGRFAELAEMSLQEGDISEARHNLLFISDAAKRMRQLIDDLLSFAHTNSTPMVSRVSIASVVSEALRNLKEEISASHGKIEFEELPYVIGNRPQLVQLFQNLIGNALKYRGEHSPIVTIKVKDEGSQFLFSISDNGIGIDSKYSDDIFKPFKRLHSMSEYPGTGLGLSICKNIVDGHSGKIWFDSRKGHGTIFHFTLAKTLNLEASVSLSYERPKYFGMNR
jgi:signal transduction histidine kinase